MRSPSILCRVAAPEKSKPSQGVPALEGLAVIDVVEGTARAALPHMAAVLAARPPAFPSLRAALDWAKSSGASPTSDRRV